jgi:hypothetical protein
MQLMQEVINSQHTEREELLIGVIIQERKLEEGLQWNNTVEDEKQKCKSAYRYLEIWIPWHFETFFCIWITSKLQVNDFQVDKTTARIWFWFWSFQFCSSFLFVSKDSITLVVLVLFCLMLMSET